MDLIIFELKISLNLVFQKTFFTMEEIELFISFIILFRASRMGAVIGSFISFINK